MTDGFGGEDTATITVSVNDVSNAPSPAEGYFDFSAAAISDFRPGDQDFGDYSLSDDGLALSQDSQSWEQILGDFSIKEDTHLRFDFSADVEGEIHGIMFTNGDDLSAKTALQIFGTQTWGYQNHNDYSAGSGVKSYDIPVGTYFTGDFDRIVFLTDDDRSVGADSTWENFELTDGSAPPPTPSPAEGYFDFSAAAISDFRPGDQDFGDYSLSDDGLALSQDSQSWEQILGDFSIKEDTHLRFDFSADVEGEIHGIMFTNGDDLSAKTALQIFGTQTWGYQNHNDYSAGSGVKSYDIPVGTYFTGDFDRIVFLTDDDRSVGADSTWENFDII